MSGKDLYRQIYKVTYVANINQMIDEMKYINVLQILSMNGFKTYHIDNFDKLTLHMKKIGLTDSFNISILLHLRDVNYKKISDVSLLFEDVGQIFSYKKDTMICRIQKIRKLLKKKLAVIKSFKKIEKMGNFNSTNNMKTDDIQISSNSMIKNKIEDEWKYNTRNDIMERLHLLAQKYFTLKQFEYMNVELKYVSEIENMTHRQLEEYYLKSLSNIEKSLKEILITCRMYIDVEVNYVECCDRMVCGLKTNLNLKHFNISIRE